MMTRLADKLPVYLELYEALAHFVGQQQLVVRVVLEQGIALADLQRGVAGWHGKTAQRGTWGADWRFRFHGGGCELKHRRTGEPIDWIAPDPLSFSAHAFIYHLQWRLAQGHPLPLLQAWLNQRGEEAILALIDDLIADGIISPERRLLPDMGFQASAA